MRNYLLEVVIFQFTKLEIEHWDYLSADYKYWVMDSLRDHLCQFLEEYPGLSMPNSHLGMA